MLFLQYDYFAFISFFGIMNKMEVSLMISNYKDFKKFLEQIDGKPKLLLHSCCGPCSSYTLSLLTKYFTVSVYYTNDNIYPESEFYLRAEEQIKIIDKMNLGVEVIIPPYHPQNYYEAVKGKEKLGEHSLRCYECYKFRLEATAKYAKENNFAYFTSTLSISPYKNSDWLNEIGYVLGEKYNIAYLYSNFKKEEGYKKSINLSKEYDIYRQDYCGCVFSLEERREQK